MRAPVFALGQLGQPQEEKSFFVAGLTAKT